MKTRLLKLMQQGVIRRIGSAWLAAMFSLPCWNGNAQIVSFGARYTGQWDQTSGSPQLTTDNAAGWSARIFATGRPDNPIITADVYQAGALSPVTISEKTYDFFEYGFDHVNAYDSAVYPSLTAMRTDFEISSPLQFYVTQGDTSQSGFVAAKPSGPYFPDVVPMFSNAQTFSAVDRNSATFEWMPWSLASSPGDVTFTLRFHDGSFIEQISSLNPASDTGVTLDPNILAVGEKYIAELTFSRMYYDTTGSWNPASLPGSLEWRYVASAEFTVVPEPWEWPMISSLTLSFLFFARRSLGKSLPSGAKYRARGTAARRFNRESEDAPGVAPACDRA